MKKLATLTTRSFPLVKTGIAIAALCLAGQALAQARPNPPVISGSPTDPSRQASAPAGDHPEHAHRELRGGPVKPQHYPSRPQPPVPTPR